MGVITTRENDNKTIDLEITYGGSEAPFGGVDASAPPMYIDPRCFVSINGFLVLDKQLVAVGWVPLNVTLQGLTNVMTFLKAGTYVFQGINYNWLLAYQITSTAAGPPPLQDIQYTIWVWLSTDTGNIPITAQCTIRQIGVTDLATTATATLVVQGSTATVAGTCSVNVASGGVATSVINIGDTPAVVATNLAAAINAMGIYPCTAAVDSKFTNQINLTASFTGWAGNNMTIIIGVTQGGGGTVPIPTTFQGFFGGANAQIGNYGIPIQPVSHTQIGETLYLSGNGTVILQFEFVNGGNPIFQPITQYLGARVLGRYNNQLIAVGIVPGPGQVIDAPELVIAWCASGQFGIWNPLFSDGTVTGAGFNQIADISDYLTGMFLTPGLALILRAQGLDYITPLSNAKIPFDFQHISNAPLGEGCQDSRYTTQYDQVGFFIGNTDVFEFTGSLTPIGNKIKDILIPITQSNINQARSAISGPFTSDSAIDVLAMFLVSRTIYIYCPNNKTWMTLNFNPFIAVSVLDLAYFATGFSGIDPYEDPSYFAPTLIYQNGSTLTFWQLLSGVQNVTFPSWKASSILFPQEEVAFGRDITIDAILINCAGVPGQVIDFTISNTLSAELVLPASASPTTFANYKVYFSASFGAESGVITVQNPQLKIDIPAANSGIAKQLKIAKIALFGSFDPAQRPV